MHNINDKLHVTNDALQRSELGVRSSLSFLDDDQSAAKVLPLTISIHPAHEQLIAKCG
jgi:hypothetical protein